MNAGWLERHKQTCDPMVEAYWTFWQALAWAIHRDADKVRGTSEDWLMICPTEERREIWLEFSFESGRARTRLVGALQSGTLTATGIDTATGKRREISALEWLDLETVQLAKAEPQFYYKGTRFDLPTRPEPVFRDVWVRVADVLKEFPAEVSVAASATSNGDGKSSGSQESGKEINTPPRRNVSQYELMAFLKEQPRLTTKPELLTRAKTHFSPCDVPTRLFNKAYGNLPSEYKRSPGDNDLTIAAKGQCNDE